MDESIDIFEHVLTGNFVHFCCKNTHFCIVLAVLADVCLFCKIDLQGIVLFVEVFHVGMQLGHFLLSCKVKFFLQVALQIHEFPRFQLELVNPLRNYLFCIHYLL
jgi:hypothetical protein